MSFFVCLELLSGMLPLILVFFLLRRFLFQNTAKTGLYLLFALYLAGVYTVVGLPNVTYIRFDPNINLIPFRDMLAGLTGTVLNVILFIPLGLFLTALWKAYRSLWKTAVFGFLLSLAIELLQLFTFRATDVNDLITNTLGTILGWWLGRLAVKRFPALPGRNAGQELIVIFTVSAAVMFLVQPLLLALVYSLL